MRKWMSDRLRRRKRGAGEGAKEQTEKAKTPEPLQPKYFDTDIQGTTAAIRDTAREPEPEPELESQPEGAEAVASHDQPASSSRSASTSSQPRTGPSRRRRRRSGRGPRSASQTAAPVPVPSGSDARPAPAEPETAAIPLPLDTGTPDTVAAELPPTAAVPVAPRPSKGTVVLAIGLPGSGKSSWFKRHNIRPLSSDLLRELLFDDAEEQRFQDLVFSNLRAMLKARLIARRPMSYVDATNLNPHERHGWIKLAKDYGYDVQGLFFDVPLEVCMERHARRGRVVPEDIMRKMAAKLKPPTFEEGFSKITVVRVKKKE